MERIVSFELGTMGCAVGFGHITRQPPGSWTHSERFVNRQRNENHSGDFVSFSANFTRRQRSGLHEGGYFIFTRDASIVRCAAHRNVARSSAMYSIGSRTTALSTPTDSVWSLVAFVAIVAFHSTVYHWVVVLQRDNRQYTDSTASRRHVSNGKIPWNRKIEKKKLNGGDCIVYN